LGTKVEVKNLNSIRNVKTAIDVEVARLTNMLDNGETIQQETRSFDADKTITFSLRSKEEANDYRYFAEPDLTPFHISQEYINSIKATLPILPAAKKIAYEQQFQLSSYDAGFATQDKATSDYFDALTNATTHYKAACNWLMGPVQNYLNEQSVGIEQFPLPAAKITELIELVAANTLSFSTASTKLFNALLAKPTANAASLASEMNLLQVSDSNELDAWVQAVLAKMPDKVAEYKKGKKGLLGLFMGEVKKLSKGKADPKLTTQLLEEKLNA
jgi:aspartyl-tRNA(Asn)/glutamyl-tRNA(Gln) amidotransferase subunit B